MITLLEEKDIGLLSEDNQIIGVFPKMINSKILFSGKYNILYCEKGVVLKNSTQSFYGDNSIIYLSENYNVYLLSISIYSNSAFHMGKNNYMNGILSVTLSEQKHCLIGDDCCLSYGITIRNADPHLIYSCKDKMRKNATKSIFIGDHVWLGQNCMLLKGTQIHSGSVIGAMSVISKKHIQHNCAWGGNPVKQIADNIFWDGSCVHGWTNEKTEASQYWDNFITTYHKNYSSDQWIYSYSENDAISFDNIDESLSDLKNSHDKYEYLLKLNQDKTKNRFC